MSAQDLGSRAILGRMYMRLTAGAIGWIDTLSFYVTSDQGSETHKWLGMTPQLRQWLSGRHVHGLRDFGITIENLKFEGTIGIGLDEIRRDKTAQVMARVDGLMFRYNTHGAKLISDLIINGAATVCYDGQFFFDTDHSEGDSGNQDNDITVDIDAVGTPSGEEGTTTAPTAKTMNVAIQKSISQLYGFVDDQAEPINETMRRVLVMVPTPFWTPGVAAVAAPSLVRGETNPLTTLNLQIDVVPNPRLNASFTDSFVTFRADDDDGVKPFIRQQETPLSIRYQAENSPEEFWNNRHVYGVDYDGNFGYGMWQHAVRTQLV